MAVSIIMPKQGQSVETCIIAEIKKKGDKVKKGEVIFSYETDKASFEEVSPQDGTVLECFYSEGDEVPVLQNVMIIGEPGENYSDLLAQTDIPAAEVEKETQQAVAKVENSPEQPALTELQPNKNNAPVSPRARHLAEKEAIETSALAGSGPNGRIIEKDVRSALENRPKLTPLAKKLAAEEGLQPTTSGSGLNGMAKSIDLSAPTNAVYGLDYEDRKLPNIRKLIAKSMQASLQNSAQLTHHLGADARRVLQLRKKAKAAFESGQLQVNITLNDFVCFAVIKALQKFPNVNSHFLGNSIRYFKKIHLGLAVDTDRGLMVPVVRNADDLSIIGLASQLKEVAAACRKGNVNPEILSPEAGTFTVSNLGNYGVEIFTPIINLPQSAILGVNTIVPRPKDLGDGVYGFVPYIGLSLTYDHRSIDGGEATRFLKQIAEEIENLEIELF
ncbi:MAG: 2-oxo acid dehydrogenase subunit E2 [Dysgonomonadaceae bacterium]|nr:2-oxo acid dehydrogenase subunit E2 [Dysgonamonadaceae bacterium]HOT65082.1 dihydrolipoamide acetyltransferase family protein [Dysgonamonadaceae bacterium]HOV35108.1 dihydrolipoamide acetyltransferase family protein [Dysgonamonadaceae bacterium]HQG07660.1 dihydrolipoamide acetyltransferase family protein [Dysgonamonadaceae bacterium]HQI43508.1 dihydrolipoamide acetyltransferase family protein [Dysgonamonadaceae bacterium]